MPPPLGPRRHPPPLGPLPCPSPHPAKSSSCPCFGPLPFFHTSLLLFRRSLLVLLRWDWPLGLTLLGGAYFCLKYPFSF